MLRAASVLLSHPITVVGLLAANFGGQLSSAATLLGIIAIIGFVIIAARLTEDHDVSD